MDIAQSTLDYVVKASVVGTMAGQGGKELSELRGLTIPVRVAGPFDKLGYKVQYSQIVRGSTKEQLDAAKRKGKEALEGLLNGDRDAAAEAEPQQPLQGEGGEPAEPAAPKRSKDELKKKLKELLR